jgi:uncharacterized protein
MTIPQYPTFRPLQLEDRAVFTQALRQHPPEVSEHTFTNLFSWRLSYGWEVTQLDGLLLLAMTRSDGRVYFEPIGAGDRRRVLARILAETGGPVRRVPASTRALFANDPVVRVEPDRDNADYLYRVAELTELKGAKYDGKRNHIKRFRNAYPEHAYLSLDASHAEACWAFQSEWCLEKNCDADLGLDAERAAIRQMFDHFREFGLTGGAIQVGGKIEAVAVGEPLNPETLVMHILKANPKFPGLTQTMLNDFLRREGAPFKYVNLEQDLGVEGLRRSKLSWHPVRLIDKFTLRKSSEG